MRASEIGDALKLLPARLYYGLDVLTGGIGGNACPNCGASGAGRSAKVRRHRFIPVIDCAGCGLLYRPVGIGASGLLDFYYSRLYTNAGVATAPDLSTDPVELTRRLRAEGKDRAALVAPLLAPFGSASAVNVCVLGCSWGYEMAPLAALGCNVVGIEISRPRREYGRRVLKLSIYGNEEEVAREVGPIDVVVSSHVLEHVPHVTGLLRRVAASLAPKVQLHITPCVESFGRDAAVSTVIGREHPIGVTHAFWRKYSTDHDLRVDLTIDGAVEGRSCGETIAVLRN
jgi:hypothetical protein